MVGTATLANLMRGSVPLVFHSSASCAGCGVIFDSALMRKLIAVCESKWVAATAHARVTNFAGKNDTPLPRAVEMIDAHEPLLDAVGGWSND